jgi:hypothetical protein
VLGGLADRTNLNLGRIVDGTTGQALNPLKEGEENQS